MKLEENMKNKIINMNPSSDSGYTKNLRVLRIWKSFK